MNGFGDRAGLYIHVPFCRAVCPYCDFAVLIAEAPRRVAWVEGVIREASLYGDLGLTFDTVYLGGGTPSMLDAETVDLVLSGVGRSLDIVEGAAGFLEANPEDVTVDSVQAWRELGVGTISIGVQSFDESRLRFLGRRHTAAAAHEAVETAASAGFACVSIDLIYGLEGQTDSEWRTDLERAISLPVDHLSCYQLTFHPHTMFGRRLAEGRISELSDDRQADLFEMTHRFLGDAGFPGYEVSNFARSPAHWSRHNLKYWKHVPYLGIGPAAHSFDGHRRWWNRRKLRLWQRDVLAGRVAVEGDERPTRAQLAFEALMLGLRLRDGIDLEEIRRRFGIDLTADNVAVLDRFSASGHLAVEGTRVRPTLAGLAIADTLARAFEIP